MISKDAKERVCHYLARRVAPMYKVVGWSWIGKPVTEQMIYERAVELLDEIGRHKPNASISAGGLVAESWKDDGGETCYSIQFCVKEYVI